MIELTLERFKSEIKKSGKPRIEDVEFICPKCKTIQSAQDLIDAGAGAGAGASIDDVEKYLAFSCVGRWTDKKGCDWTLGGLFQIHEMEVITPDGKHHPRFKLAHMK